MNFWTGDEIRWTGDEIRRHFGAIAHKVDAGEVTATMNLDRHGYDLNVWSLVVRETEKGAQLRKARRLADELDVEPLPHPRYGSQGHPDSGEHIW